MPDSRRLAWQRLDGKGLVDDPDITMKEGSIDDAEAAEVKPAAKSKAAKQKPAAKADAEAAEVKPATKSKAAKKKPAAKAAAKAAQKKSVQEEKKDDKRHKRSQFKRK